MRGPPAEPIRLIRRAVRHQTHLRKRFHSYGGFIIGFMYWVPTLRPVGSHGLCRRGPSQKSSIRQTKVPPGCRWQVLRWRGRDNSRQVPSPLRKWQHLRARAGLWSVSEERRSELKTGCCKRRMNLNEIKVTSTAPPNTESKRGLNTPKISRKPKTCSGSVIPDITRPNPNKPPASTALNENFFMA